MVTCLGIIHHHYPKLILDILSVIIFNFLLYHRTLSYGLVIDDIDWYNQWKNNYGYHHMKWWYWLKPHVILKRFYGCATFGLNTKLDHSITLTLHILTSCLLLHYNLIASLLFSCHPSNHQTSIWLTGRRYSIINIIFLTLLITHTIYLIFIVLIPIAIHYKLSLSQRITRNVPTGIYTPLSILRCLYYSIVKLSGFIRYSFRYPYHNTCPYLPCTQPIAERYLSIPLIITCIALSKIPFIWLILPIYAFRTLQLIPMYRCIQSFYDYHRFLYPNLEKLVLIKSLYPQIKT